MKSMVSDVLPTRNVALSRRAILQKRVELREDVSAGDDPYIILLAKYGARRLDGAGQMHLLPHATTPRKQKKRVSNLRGPYKYLKDGHKVRKKSCC